MVVVLPRVAETGTTSESIANSMMHGAAAVPCAASDLKVKHAATEEESASTGARFVEVTTGALMEPSSWMAPATRSLSVLMVVAAAAAEALSES